MTMHKVFISYHHRRDRDYKNRLLELNQVHRLFIDGSVDTEDIDADLPDSRIREIIRDDYLRDTTVTVVLAGIATRSRKHVDWEIYSSMYDGTRNKKSGVLAINLPETGCTYWTAAHEREKEVVYPDVQTLWTSIDERAEYERRYPHMPDRIIDNLMQSNAKLSVTNWDRIVDDPAKLGFLIESAHSDRAACKYDLSRPMRRSNS